MAKMTAIEAAVLVLEKEGVTTAFGVPGAAINPLYATLAKRRTIRHILGRHVEGAAHMAEGYTRAKAGNIGVCIGTSGPAGTDMITGLYSAIADSIPILCITGQAPRARLHKEDFQAVDIAAIAAPVAKWATTVLEPGQVPRVFQKAFHLMRSGRPGPVLIDLPVDVQTSVIEFDIETYAPLEVYKPSATRAQIERALAMLNEAERPLIVAGGGVINADACAELVEFAEITGVPVIPTLMGWGAIPDDHDLMAGMVGLQTSHRYGNATFMASDFVLGIGNRWANRHTGSVDAYTKGRRFVHVDIEPTQIGRVFNPDFGITSDAGAALRLFIEVAREWRDAGRLVDRSAWAGRCLHLKQNMLRKSHFDQVPLKPQRVYQEMNEAFDRDTCYVTTIGLSQIAGAQFLHVYKPRNWINCGQAGPLGWTLAGGPGCQGGGSRPADRGPFGRLRFPVHDRGTGRGGAAQAALPACRHQQLLSRADPPGAARFRHRFRGQPRLRQHQCRPDRRRAGLWGRSLCGGRGAGLQGHSGDEPQRVQGGVRQGSCDDEGAPGAGGARVHHRAGDEHRDGYRDPQRQRVRGDPLPRSEPEPRGCRGHGARRAGGGREQQAAGLRARGRYQHDLPT
jgi:tartronate-semialdehyde synthase